MLPVLVFFHFIICIALVGLVLVVYRAIDEPDAAGGALSVSVGVWLALGACATLVAGSFLAIRDESPGAPAPPVEAEEIPAPRP